MTILDLISTKMEKKSTSKGGEYHGPCPLCGGEDRFHAWPHQGTHGTYWCRGCNKGGDAIQFLRDFEGLSYHDACRKLGIQAMETAPPNSPPRTRATERNNFSPVASTLPPHLWSEKAALFVEWCHKNLLANPEQLAWLAAHGIGPDMVAKYLLGWNPADAWRPRVSWGLLPELKENGEQKKLWLPSGLIIPWHIMGLCCRLRVRRSAGEPRYFVIPGSGRQPLITRPDALAYMVVESELDAILLDCLAGDLVGVIALGNNSAKPDQVAHVFLSAAVHISVALDFDEPGAKAVPWWLAQYSTAERTPVVGGKDPCDMFAAGENVRVWILAGLPPRFQTDNTSKVNVRAIHESPLRPTPTIPENVAELARLMIPGNVRLKLDTTEWEIEWDEEWRQKHERDAARIMAFVYGSQPVIDYLTQLPPGTYAAGDLTGRTA